MNKTKKTIALTSVLLITLALVVGGITMVYAETDQDETDIVPHQSRFGWKMHGPFMGCLDEEQRQEMKDIIDEMREEDAAPEEIRETIKEFMDENGIECQKPELTEEQLEALKELREKMKEKRENGEFHEGMRGPRMGLGRRGGTGFPKHQPNPEVQDG